MKQASFFLILSVFLFSCQDRGSSWPDLSSFPKGSIIGWASKASVPKGWVICNGANGTPNLVDRFPFGTSNSSEIGMLIGQSTHNHEVSGTTGIPDQPMPFNGDNSALQKDGGSRVHHTHSFKVTSSDASSIPPAAKIIFIMKI